MTEESITGEWGFELPKYTCPTMLIVIGRFKISIEPKRADAPGPSVSANLAKIVGEQQRKVCRPYCIIAHTATRHGEMRGSHHALPLRSSLGQPQLLHALTRANSTSSGRGYAPVLSDESDEVKVKVKVGLNGFVPLRCFFIIDLSTLQY